MPVFAQSGTEVLDLPLSGAAFRIANEAYDAFNKGDYETAISKAREAIRQRPDSLRLRVLLIDALNAAGKADEAAAESKAALETAANIPAAKAEANEIRNKLANSIANEIYKAMARKDYPAAIKSAKEAIKLAPDQLAYRHLLILAELRANNMNAAEQAATETLDSDNEDAVALILRSFSRLKQHKLNEGVHDTEAALKLEDMSDDDLNNVRLNAVDYLIAVGDYAKARAVLSQFTGDPALKAFRLNRIAYFERTAGANLTDKAISKLKLPDLDCRETAYGRGCALIPDTVTADEGYNDATQALAAYKAKDYTAALTSIKKAIALAPENAEYKRMQSTILAELQLQSASAQAASGRTSRLAARGNAIDISFTSSVPDKGYKTVKQIDALLQANDREQARRTYEAALANGTFKTLRPIDLAYLATRIGDKYTANEQFTLAQAKGQLSGTSLIDAAYAARRIYDNDRAIELLKAAIDSLGPSMEPQRLFELRREVADLSRTWGATLSINHNAIGVSPGSPQQSSNPNSTQFGSEIYWRPKGIGYRDGALFELFARNFTTIDDTAGNQTGWQTSQGSFGARWKPLRDYNLVLEAARLVPFGKYATKDTMLRIAYSEGQGTDLRVDVPSWWMWTVYGEAVRYMEARQNIASFEARFGRSFRMDEISDRLVLTPFLAFGSNYNNLLDPKWAVGTGPGLSLRLWFREDKYTAPMSYIEATAQYRFKLAGDDRAEGIFANLILSY
ncbi:tetratricopeptide repeat protein [Daeguia caeni]|uniref:Tetratricopeptide repeat protein n=1 Tax=Daeguia caeni TaxID=439612 RepID=A0ABV9H1Y7_9HYPH